METYTIGFCIFESCHVTGRAHENRLGDIGSRRHRNVVRANDSRAAIAGINITSINADVTINLEFLDA